MVDRDLELTIIITDAWSKGLTIKQTAAKAAEAGHFASRLQIKRSFVQMNATFEKFCNRRAQRQMSKYQ